MIDDDKSYPIPAKFRASLDITDEAANELLKRNDIEQKRLGEKIAAPFIQNTPLERQRSKAFITIESLKHVPNLTDDQCEILAEAFASTGRYDLASEISKLHGDHYQTYWDAVWLSDDQWCGHPARHTFVKENAWSIKEGKELPMLKCNLCGMMNVLDSSDEIKVRQLYQAGHQGKTAGMTIAQSIEWHKKNVKSG